MSLTIQYVIIGVIFAIIIFGIIRTKLKKKEKSQSFSCNCSSCCRNCNSLQRQKTEAAKKRQKTNEGNKKTLENLCD